MALHGNTGAAVGKPAYGPTSGGVKPSPFVAVMLGTHGDVRAINAHAARILEVSEKEIVGKNWFDAFVPDDQREEVVQAFKRSTASNDHFGANYFGDVVTTSGKRMTLNWHNASVTTGAETHAISIGRLIQEKSADEVVFSAMFESAVEGLVFADCSGEIRLVNPATERMFGWSADELIGQNVKVLMPMRDAVQHDGHIQRFIDDGSVRVIGRGRELMGKRKDKSVFPMYLSVAFVESGPQRGFAAFIHDITEQKEAELRSHKLAYYCGITGLPNRESLVQYLKPLLAKRADKTSVTVIGVSIRRFSEINSVHGHSASNAVVLELAKRLKEAAEKEAAFLCRYSNGDFVIAISGERDSDRSDAIAQAVHSVAVTPVQVETARIDIGLVVGIAKCPDKETDVEELLQNLESAVIEARKSDVNSVVVFNSSIQEEIERHLTLETKLRAAVDHGDGFEVYYQPKHRAVTGELIGAEALLRWCDDDLGAVPPSDFIPIAEQTGLINPLGEWVLSKAMRFASEVQQALAADFHIAVNFSARQFRSGSLHDLIASELSKSSVNPNLLQIELTEGSLIVDTSATVEMLSGLKEMGITVAVDDFGTGFSSLSYLKQFPLDVLKIDKSFIDGIPHSSVDCAISKSIVTLSQALGFEVVAEGVETQKQAQFLRSLGCDQLQGYLFSKPTPADQFLSYALGMFEAHRGGR